MTVKSDSMVTFGFHYKTTPASPGVRRDIFIRIQNIVEKMETSLDWSLQTTLSSLDLGTTVDESFSLTSTPMKNGRVAFSEAFVCEHSPVSRKLTPCVVGTAHIGRESMAVNLHTLRHRINDITDDSLTAFSFKKGKQQPCCRRLRPHSDNITASIRDKGIKRRHSDICQQRARYSAVFRTASLDNVLQEHPIRPVKRARLVPDLALCVSSFEASLKGSLLLHTVSWNQRSGLVPLSRNTVTTSDLGESNQPSTDRTLMIETLRTKTSPVLSLLDTPRQKMCKQGSFRIRNFIERKFKSIFGR